LTVTQIAPKSTVSMCATIPKSADFLPRQVRVGCDKLRPTTLNAGSRLTQDHEVHQNRVGRPGVADEFRLGHPPNEGNNLGRRSLHLIEVDG
jgi:hypothetical protein